MADKAAGVGAEKRPPGNQPGEVQHQGRNLPFCPVRVAIGGVAVGAVYSRKQPEATAVEAATADNTYRPHN
ncbi:hypothetical protein Nepgr_011443 [Nepenthes gracilis]|uniref:Uncharacterized protein n=1 Tax=Nepenthes gracilis TaxID=150966 RepID=A0AAD3SFG8_NEPGR|nr:hypothetical protein Nepgr_011443 [Nepenthes gracilis]